MVCLDYKPQNNVLSSNSTPNTTITKEYDYNHPVCIFQTDEDGNPIQLNKEVLERILLDDRVADKRVNQNFYVF
jgi:hypothetical protein